MTTNLADPPPRGTRPRNRRDLVRETAAVLFAEKGYAQVSLNQVSEALNVGRSALYRHYASKAELLYDAADARLDQIVSHLPDPGADPQTLITVLVNDVLDARYIGVLWQRESRNLPLVQRASLRRKVQLVNDALTTALRTSRPGLTAGQADLLAACAVDAATSISFHHLQLPKTTFAALLSDLCLGLLAMEPALPGAAALRTGPQRPAGSRADELVDASIRLFAESGYAAVSIDDIGAAVGITGPSVYKHFASKHELLLEAMMRGTDQLLGDLQAASDSDPATHLRQISDAYVTMALDHSDLIGTLIGETMHLDTDAQRRIRRIQRGVIDNWVALMVDQRPDEDPIVARIKVQAAQMVANDIARTPHLRKVNGFRQLVLDACWQLQQ